MLRTYRYCSDFYYRLRATSPRSPTKMAARVLYLNHACWNGLYRVNRAGNFNTPFGKLTNPTICDPDRIRLAANLLRRARLHAGDFGRMLAHAKAGDFVYCDPPYISGHLRNGFLKYNARLFSWSDQERLALKARRLAEAGVYVLTSNADQPEVIELYKGFYYYRVRRLSLIGGQTNSRGSVAEALLSNYQLLGCDSEVV